MMNKLLIRSSKLEDLSYVMKEEEKAAKLGYVAKWSFEEHLAGINREKTYHMVIENNGRRVGYTILNYDKDDNVELMRLVISQKHLGYGRQSLTLIKQLAFEELKCNRLWLDVRVHNHYAVNVYQETGFFEEGTLRNCVKLQDEYVSIKVFSILRSDYET